MEDQGVFIPTASIYGGYGLTPLLYPELQQGRMRVEVMVPKGYRHYARSEGLDPLSYFQIVKQQPSPSNNQGIKSAAAGFGSPWKLLSRLLGILRNYK